jgi:hypothetical protein
MGTGKVPTKFSEFVDMIPAGAEADEAKKAFGVLDSAKGMTFSANMELYACVGKDVQVGDSAFPATEIDMAGEGEGLPDWITMKSSTGCRSLDWKILLPAARLPRSSRTQMGPRIVPDAVTLSAKVR